MLVSEKDDGVALSGERHEHTSPVQRPHLHWRNHPGDPCLVKKGKKDLSHLLAYQIRSYSCVCSLSASRKLFRARQSRVSTAWRVRPVFAASSSVLANLK